MSKGSLEKGSQKFDLPWKWKGVPGSYLDERPHTKTEYTVAEPEFPPKVDKYPEDDGIIACFKIDDDTLGNVNTSNILLSDVLHGPVLDGGVF